MLWFVDTAYTTIEIRKILNITTANLRLHKMAHAEHTDTL